MIFVAIHKGTGEPVAKFESTDAEHTRSVLDLIARDLDYAPYDLMARPVDHAMSATGTSAA